MALSMSTLAIADPVLHQCKEVGSIKCECSVPEWMERKKMAEKWITVSAVKGPSNYEYDPLTRNIKTNDKSERSLHSIILTISANPLHRPRLMPERDSVRNFDQDLTNLLLDFTLEPQFCKRDQDNNTPTATERPHCSPAEEKPSNGTEPQNCPSEEKKTTQPTIRILAIYPNQTLASTRDGTVGSIGRLVGTIFDGLTGELTSGARTITRKDGDDSYEIANPSTSITYKSSGMGSVLANLVPPRATPMQYGYIKDNFSFGWRLRQNTRSPEGVSLLGIRNGVVIYELIENKTDVCQIKGIKVTWQALARWKQDFEDKSNWVESHGNGEGQEIAVTPQDQRKSNRKESLGTLKDLDTMPAVIGIEDVERILGIDANSTECFRSNPNCFLNTNADNALTVIDAAQAGSNADRNSKKKITRNSLERFLGLHKPEKDPKK